MEHGDIEKKYREMLFSYRIALDCTDFEETLCDMLDDLIAFQVQHNLPPISTYFTISR